jgi:hypothetical protein
MEQHAFERVRLRAGDERDALEGRSGRGAHHHAHVVRAEADEPGAYRLVGAARYLRVAWLHLDAVWRGRFGAPRNDQQRREAVADVRGAERNHQRRHGRDRRQHHALVPERRAFRHAAIVERAALGDRALDQLLDEPRRVRPAAGFGEGSRLDGADEGRFERGIALLEIHRHLCIAHAAAQRPDQAVAQQADEHRDGDDAEGDDRSGAEPEGLEPGGGEQQRQHRAGDDDHGAAQRELHAPPVPDASDDVDELEVMVHVGALPQGKISISRP